MQIDFLAHLAHILPEVYVSIYNSILSNYASTITTQPTWSRLIDVLSST